MLLQQPTPMMRQFLFDNLLQNRVHHIEALELLNLLPDQSIDAIITDLPYGTTACAWDQIIPFEPMWEGVRRVLKPRGAFVTTASQPFTSALVMSNPEMFRYEWIWRKNQATGMMNARFRPLKEHESIVVFSPNKTRANQFDDDVCAYYPQGVIETEQREKSKSQVTAINNLRGIKPGYYTRTQTNFPKTILEFDVEIGRHPTQKPVALYRYLVRTYTRPGDLVLDFCCGSATTAEAARAEGRRWICGEKEAEIVAVARDRLRMPFERRHVVKETRVDDLPLFAAVGGD